MNDSPSELTDAEIAVAFRGLIADAFKALQNAKASLTTAREKVYVSQDNREEEEQNAEYALRRASDDVIVLGKVVEHARASRLVTTS